MDRYTARIIFTLTIVMVAPLANAAPNLSIETLQVVSEVMPRERIWNGTVEAVNQSTVSAQTSGRVARINYDVNDFVPKDAVIVRFTDTEQNAALRIAKATVEEAEARLDEAGLEFQRIESMFENQTISKARFDQAKANNAAAEARLNAARSGVTAAEEQLEYTVVRTPFAGIVAERYVEVGELVTPGQPIMKGLSLQLLRVNVDIPQSMFNAVREIGKAYIYADDQRIVAQSLTFFPIADSITNSFTVRVNLPEDSTALLPGMYVKVGFVVGQTQRLLVPYNAVVRRSELTAVYILTDNQVTLRQVRLGRRYDSRIEILAGVSESERVATNPVEAGIFLKEHNAAAIGDE